MSYTVTAVFNLKFNQFVQTAQAAGRYVGMTPEQIQDDPKAMALFAKCLIHENMSPMAVKESAAPRENPVTTQGKALKHVDESGKRLTQKERIYRWLNANPGAAREDVTDALDMVHSAVTARISELKDEGRITAYGTKMGANGIEVERLYALTNAAT